MIWCKIDHKLIRLLLRYARKKVIVDCGAGLGLLGYYIKRNILSIDLYPSKAFEYSNVLKYDYRYFPFNYNMLPVFIRPIADDTVHETIINNRHVESFLYINMPELVRRNLGSSIYIISLLFSEWRGSDGERVFEIKWRV